MSTHSSQLNDPPDFWQIASEGLSGVLRREVDVDEIRQWATNQNGVELLQSLQPDAEHKEQAQFKGMTASEILEARRQKRKKNPRKQRLSIDSAGRPRGSAG
jgi:hypothetical protein